MEKKERVNEQIRAREVRVIDENGAQVGIMPVSKALAIAEERGLDLVEVSPLSKPPVCKIMNHGKFLYEKKKKEHEAKRKQRHIHVKEIKFRPKTDEHDFQFKKKHIQRFLSDGDKVKISILFRGREIIHPEIGKAILDRLISELQEEGIVEMSPRLEGPFMMMIMAPRPKA
ncbi:MAG: translation initiation factor IF-3 [Acidobacteriota bacterium]